MKRKFLVIMLITTLISSVGCVDKGGEDEYQVLDTIILDENSKATIDKNTKLDIEMIAKTEGISGGEYFWGTLIDKKVVYYTMKSDDDDDDDDGVTQFQKQYLESVKVGDITEKKDSETGLNKILWEDKSFEGIVLQNFNKIWQVRVINDNKGYRFNSEGELEELEVYESFLQKYSGVHSPLESQADGTIDMFCVNENNEKKIVLLDIINNESYEISMEVFDDFSKEAFNEEFNRRVVVLGIDNNRIYVSLDNISSHTANGKTGESIVGYIEDNKFTSIFSTDNELNIDILGGVLYSNGKILFSGYVEEKNGIWSYDISSKKLIKQLEIGDNFLFDFSLNPTKDKIMISGSNSSLKGNVNFIINLAKIDENLNISNLTSIVDSKTKSGIKSLAGWSDDGNEFYLYTSIPKDKDVIGAMETSYEVYKIKE